MGKLKEEFKDVQTNLHLASKLDGLFETPTEMFNYFYAGQYKLTFAERQRRAAQRSFINQWSHWVFEDYLHKHVKNLKYVDFGTVIEDGVANPKTTCQFKTYFENDGQNYQLSWEAELVADDKQTTHNELMLPTTLTGKVELKIKLLSIINETNSLLAVRKQLIDPTIKNEDNIAQLRRETVLRQIQAGYQANYKYRDKRWVWQLEAWVRQLPRARYILSQESDAHWIKQLAAWHTYKAIRDELLTGRFDQDLLTQVLNLSRQLPEEESVINLEDAQRDSEFQEVVNDVKQEWETVLNGIFGCDVEIGVNA